MFDFNISDEQLAALPEKDRQPWLDYRKRREEVKERIEQEASARNFTTALALLDSKDRASYMVEFDERYTFTKAETRKLLRHFWSVTEAWSGDEDVRDGMYRMLKRVAPISVYGEPKRPLRNEKWLSIYRGNLGETPGAHMMSWTLDRKVAEFFARMGMGARGRFLGMYREGGIPTVWQAHVLRKNVLGYFDDRDEQEVVVDGVDLHNLELIAQAVRPTKEEE